MRTLDRIETIARRLAPKQYRKREQVTTTALQWWDDLAAMQLFTQLEVQKTINGGLLLQTGDGIKTASRGDWVIRIVGYRVKIITLPNLKFNTVYVEAVPPQ